MGPELTVDVRHRDRAVAGIDLEPTLNTRHRDSAVGRLQIAGPIYTSHVYGTVARPCLYGRVFGNDNFDLGLGRAPERYARACFFSDDGDGISIERCTVRNAVGNRKFCFDIDNTVVTNDDFDAAVEAGDIDCRIFAYLKCVFLVLVFGTI